MPSSNWHWSLCLLACPRVPVASILVCVRTTWLSALAPPHFGFCCLSWRRENGLLQEAKAQFFTQSLDPIRRYSRYSLPSSTLPNTLTPVCLYSLPILFSPTTHCMMRTLYLSVPYQADYHSITSSDRFRYREYRFSFLLPRHYSTLASLIRARH
jgi:hypothetical protein